MDYKKWENIVDNYNMQCKFKEVSKMLSSETAQTILDESDNNLSYESIMSLASIIVDNTPVLHRKKYNNKISLKDSILLATKILNRINPEYNERFQNILLYETHLYEDFSFDTNFIEMKEKYAINFKKASKHNQRSNITVEGVINIRYNKTLNDLFAIIHEITHKFSMSDFPFGKGYKFCEVPSITMEWLIFDELLDENDEAYFYIHNRLYSTQIHASELLFKDILVKLYKQNNKVTLSIFMNYLNNMDKNSNLYKMLINNWETYLDNIVHSVCIKIGQGYLYIIGTSLATYLHQQILESENNSYRLFKLIHLLGDGNININQLNELFSLNIVENEKLNIDDNAKNIITECYRNEVNNLMKYENKIKRKIKEK